VPRNQRPHVLCPSVTAFWNNLAKLLHELLGPHPLQKKLILYSYSTLNNTPQQRTNYLLVLAKITIYKTYLATNSTHTPDYQRMFHMRLQYRLYTEMHCSLWTNDANTFRGYWLHGNILGKICDERSYSTDLEAAMHCPSDCFSDAVHNPYIL
jgi:hypothetical protein